MMIWLQTVVDVTDETLCKADDREETLRKRLRYVHATWQQTYGTCTREWLGQLRGLGSLRML